MDFINFVEDFPLGLAVIHFVLVENKSKHKNPELLNTISEVYQTYGEKTQDKQGENEIMLIYDNIDAFKRLMMAVFAYLDKFGEKTKTD